MLTHDTACQQERKVEFGFLEAILIPPCLTYPRAYSALTDSIAPKIADMKQRRADLGGADMQFGMAAFAIVRDSEAEAKRELERITALPPKPPTGFDNFDQWLSGTKFERELKLQEYSVSNRGLRPNLVGTPEQLCERIEEYEAVGLDLLLLQMSPQAEEMDRFAEQVIQPMRARH